MLKKGILFLFLIASFYGKAQDDRYFMLWNKNEISVEPWEKVSLSFTERMQYDIESNILGAVFGQLAIKHEPKIWLAYGSAMRISHLNQQNGNWINENRPLLFITLKKSLNKFELSFSNRIEYRSYKQLEDHFRHKQTLRLKFPQLLDWGMQFYISEESFYKMNGTGTHQARFQSGVTAVDKDWFAIKIYYILEKTKADNSWFASDIVGLNLSFSI